MEDILTFTIWIVIIFGILQIILFFKLWGMTNDTKKIKNTVQANGYPSGISPAIIEFTLGNTEKAQEMAKREFICEVYELYSYALKQLDSLKDKEYTEKFNEIESKYRNRFDNASSFIEFGKFSTFENAKKVFH